MFSPELRQAYENYNSLDATPEEREAARVRFKYLMDEHSVRREAELREKKSFERGIEIGKHNVKLEVARNLLKDNFDTETVARLSGLSIKEVRIIQQNLD